MSTEYSGKAAELNRCHPSPVKHLLFTLLGALVLCSGCSGLPEYAQPHLSSGGGNIPEHIVTYRTLTRADFQAVSVPARLSKHQKKLNAHTAVSIRPVAGAEFTITRGMVGDQLVFYGRVDHLAFEAVMIPEQSWWNPTVATKRQTYVLQHEQIHFALMELAARKLTWRMRADLSLTSLYGGSAAEIRNELRVVIGQLLDESQRLALKSHTEFDEDTSLQYNPGVQQEWHNKVMAELERFSVSNHVKPRT